MQIGMLAKKTGTSVDTLRFYEREGLVRADRRANGYRDFPEGAVDLVKLIRLAQGLGFSLSEIGVLMQGLNGGYDTDEVTALLRDKLDEIDGRIAGMTQLREAVAARLAAACPLGL